MSVGQPSMSHSTETHRPWAIFGHIPGIQEGQTFKNRVECYNSNVHRRLQHGIEGTEEDGAYSICIAGGYTDNRDDGYTIVYSGEGRGAKKSDDETEVKASSYDDKQRGDQEWRRGNQALRTSFQTERPVRVVRGTPSKNYENYSKYTPVSGYRYDGLYTVTECSRVRGKNGFLVCLFTLERIPNQRPIPETSWWRNTLHRKRKTKRIERASGYPSCVKKRSSVPSNAALSERPDPVQRGLRRERAARSSPSLTGAQKRHLSKHTPSLPIPPATAPTASSHREGHHLQHAIRPTGLWSASPSGNSRNVPTETKTRTDGRTTGRALVERNKVPRHPLSMDTTRSLALFNNLQINLG